MKTYIGIDNGTTGTIGIINEDGVIFECVPTKKEQSYTKAKNMITRIDHIELCHFLKNYMMHAFVLVERPFVNPKMFKSSILAVRALESVVIALEALDIPYQYIDSREWQKALLPKGIEGSANLKKAGVDIAKRLFPHIDCGKDADGLLIAEYARRMNF